MNYPSADENIHEKRVAKLLETEKADTSRQHDQTILANIDATAQRIADKKLDESRLLRKKLLRVGLPVAVAASVVVAVFVAPTLRVDQAIDDPLRSQSAIADVSPKHQGQLSAAPTELRWVSQVNASTYQVKLRDGSGVLLWTSKSLSEPRVDIPENIVDLIQAQGSYLWTVAVSGNAAQSELGPFAFSIAR